MKNYILTISLLLGSLSYAQNSTDALQFSRSDVSGSARFIGMGGSFGALGGEASGIAINPGGIGVYRNSEFTFSTGFNNYRASTNFRNNDRTDGRFNMNIPNIGYIKNYSIDKNGWKSYTIGFVHNRLNHFGNEQRASGNSDNSTFVDDYVDQLNNDGALPSQLGNYNLYPFGAEQAWNTILIDTLTNPNTGLVDYIPYVFLHQIADSSITGRSVRNVTNISQTRFTDSRGNQGETQLVFGGNFQDKLYIGGSLNMQTISFERSVTFREEYSYDDPATSTDTHLATSYEQTTSLLTDGVGVNLKIGGIYRVTEDFRVGLAFQSPTIMQMDELFVIDATSEFANGDQFVAETVESTWGYQIITPARVNASAAYIFFQRAALNVDYEYLDYSTALFNDRRTFDNDYSPQNEEIETFLTNAHNVRVGAEYKFNPFVLRAGFNYQGNPYDDEFSVSDESRNTYSVGGGFRNNNFNFDVGINWRNATIRENFYATSDAVATIDENVTNVVFTVGWKW